jgi:hypothetical protein
LGTAGQHDLLNGAGSAGGIFNTTPEMEKLFQSKRLLHLHSAASQYNVKGCNRYCKFAKAKSQFKYGQRLLCKHRSHASVQAPKVDRAMTIDW